MIKVNVGGAPGNQMYADQIGADGYAQDAGMIFLYRRPILEYCAETGEDLSHVIRHVLIHEIGHHFGLSDADMERIERQG